LPFLRFGEVVPEATDEPDGTDVKSTLWVAVSWLVNVIVVPEVTESVDGEKLSWLLLPTPEGMVTVCPAELEAPLVVLVDEPPCVVEGRARGPLRSTAPSAMGITIAMTATSARTIFVEPVIFWLIFSLDYREREK
jgi:hypothetical protein